MPPVLLTSPPLLPTLQVSWLGEEPVAGVWSEKGQVEVFVLRRLLQVVDDPQALATFLRDEQTRVKPIFAFSGHMGEGFALDWSPRVPGEFWGWVGMGSGEPQLAECDAVKSPDCLSQGAC